MTRSIRGRAAVLMAGAAASTLLVSGCGAGQIAETAAKEPTNTGVNVQTADNSIKIRNLTVAYPGTTGYPAGADAPLNLAIYNDSEKVVTVRVSSTAARAVVRTGGPGNPPPTANPAAPSPSGSDPARLPGGTPSATGSSGASPSATGSPASPTPAATPSGAPAELQIPAGGFVVLNRSAGTWLQLAGLNAALRPGQSVDLVFDIDGQQLPAPAPVAVPLTPAPVTTPEVADEEGHG